MAPNFYIHITLLQPHRQTVNDLPIRMYGVQNISVSNPASHLTPVIDCPDVICPQTPFSLRIKEEKGKTMTYTLAVVDEGLLDLTAFRTPNPWSAMNERQALGVRTWDMYDDVIGAYARCAYGRQHQRSQQRKDKPLHRHAPIMVRNVRSSGSAA